MPSTPARAAPLRCSPVVTATTATTATDNVHSAQPLVSALAEPLSGDAPATRHIPRPASTVTTATHSAPEMGSW